MVQTNGVLYLRISKGRRNLVFYHSAPSAILDDLTPLGFSPTKVSTNTAWERAFHPALVEQLQNLYGPLSIDETLADILEKNSSANVHKIDTSIILNDAQLKPWQREPIEFIASRKKAFLALAPGLGKTLCALRAVEAAGYKYVYVVCPLSLLRNWKREIEKWLPDSRVMLLSNDEQVVSGAKDAAHRIIVMSYESFLKYYTNISFRAKPGLIILDESVLLKNRDTMRFAGRKAKLSKHKKLLPAIIGVRDLVKDHKGSLWLLTGGPTAKFLDDLWAQLHLLDPKRFSSYHQFKHHYCVVQETPWGEKIVANKSGAVELLRKDLADIYYAKTQDEVEDLPPFVFERIEVEMESDQAKIYTQMEKEFLAALPSGDEVIAASVLTQMLRLTQIASNASLLEDDGIIPISSAKWEAVASLVEFAPKPLLIWTNFIRTAALLGPRLQNYRVATLTGQVASAERQGVVESFQAGELDVLIAHPAVGKYGHTLTRARSAIYVERSFNGDDFYQSLYRIRRIGTKESPQVFFVLSTNKGKRTVDHAIDAVLQYKHDNNIEMITSRTLRQAWEGKWESST